jgi:glycosyltransferase involved in cell wall biosynthesis
MGSDSVVAGQADDGRVAFIQCKGTLVNLHVVSRRFKTGLRYAREQGFWAFLHLVRHKMARKRGSIFAKTDVIGFYDFVRYRPTGEPLTSVHAVQSNSINWIIPPYGRGSGGHLNIFRFIHHLEVLGFNCRVIIFGETQLRSSEQAKREIADWFFPLQAEVYLGLEQAPPAQVTVATSWQTAYAARNFQATAHRCYFVQDFEPWFYAMGTEYAFAEETYRFGFTGITAGDWLATKLANNYGMKTSSVGFSYDYDRYTPKPRRESDVRRVFFYARPPTLRRAFELGLLVLHEVTKRLPDVKIVFAGWDVSSYAIPFDHLNAGVLSLDELPDLYSQCDVALVLSFSNLSLLPLELMACGTPVVSNRGPFTEWLLNESNARLAAPTVEDLTEALCEVLENKDEQARLRQAGLETAHKTSWISEAEKMASIFSGLNSRSTAKE